MQISRRSLARNYSILVAPLLIRSELGIGKRRPLASVFISDPEKTMPVSQANVLQELYNFTPTEAKVAVEMMSFAALMRLNAFISEASHSFQI
jgi:hypothetical protein